MTRRSAPLAIPRDWLKDGTWPDGTFREDTPDAVAYAVHIAKHLEAALEGRNKTTVAAQARMERTTLYDLLSGRSWPEIVTLAKLEGVLGVPLWPPAPPALRRHVP